MLGGLLSIHFAHLKLHIPNYQNEFLDLSEKLAEKLSLAFISDNKLPHRHVNLKYGIPNAYSSKEINVAEIGTLSLEFSILTKLTNN